MCLYRQIAATQVEKNALHETDKRHQAGKAAGYCKIQETRHIWKIVEIVMGRCGNRDWGWERSQDIHQRQAEFHAGVNNIVRIRVT